MQLAHKIEIKPNGTQEQNYCKLVDVQDLLIIGHLLNGNQCTKRGN